MMKMNYSDDTTFSEEEWRLIDLEIEAQDLRIEARHRGAVQKKAKEPEARQEPIPTPKTDTGFDWSAFKLDVGFDWLKVELQLSKAVCSRTLSALLSKLLGYSPTMDIIEGEEFKPGTGKVGTAYTFNVQNPKSQAEVTALADHLRRALPLRAEPRIIASEVRLDLKRKDGTTDRQLAEAVARLYTFDTWRPKDDTGAFCKNDRLYTVLKDTRQWDGKGKQIGGKKHDDVLSVPGSLSTLIGAILGEYGFSYTIGIGNHGDNNNKFGNVTKATPQASRYYLKRTDDSQDLPEALWCARVERTFQGSGQPFGDLLGLSEWVTRGAGDALRDLFSFRRLSENPNPWTARALQGGSFAIHTKKTRNRSEGGTREHSASSRADSTLNALVAAAVKRFVRQWQKPSACGNSDIQNAVLPLSDDQSLITTTSSLSSLYSSSSSSSSSLTSTTSSSLTSTDSSSSTPTTTTSTTSVTPDFPSLMHMHEDDKKRGAAEGCDKLPSSSLSVLVGSLSLSLLSDSVHSISSLYGSIN